MPNQHRINIDSVSLGNGGGLPTTTSSFLPDLLNNRRPSTAPLLRTRRQRVLWAVALGGFVFFLFLFSHATPPVRSAFTPTTAGGGAPSPKPDSSSGLSGLSSGGGIKASPPEGEYDAHGTGESFGSTGDAPGAHSGDDDIDKEKDETELEAELGFSEPEPIKGESTSVSPRPPHSLRCSPRSLSSPLFLISGLAAVGAFLVRVSCASPSIRHVSHSLTMVSYTLVP